MFKINMLSLGIIFLVMTIPLASLYLLTILIHRFALLILLFSNLFYDTSLSVEILGGLFQPTFENLDIFILSFIPVIIYSNTDTDKLQIITDTKGKTGIYLWTHKESGKIYVGSSYDLASRFSNYFSIS